MYLKLFLNFNGFTNLKRELIKCTVNTHMSVFFKKIHKHLNIGIKNKYIHNT